jgi:hypothetical protein
MDIYDSKPQEPKYRNSPGLNYSKSASTRAERYGRGRWLFPAVLIGAVLCLIVFLFLFA